MPCTRSPSFTAGRYSNILGPLDFGGNVQYIYSICIEFCLILQVRCGSMGFHNIKIPFVALVNAPGKLQVRLNRALTASTDSDG